MTKYKIGSGFAPLSPCSDRFVTSGYRDPINLEDQIKLASGIEGLRGVAFDYPYQIKDEDIGPVRKMVSGVGLEIATLEVGLYPDRKWKFGTICSPDPGIRRDAIEMSKRSLEIAEEIGAPDVLFWPGQDGFDYPFQADYMHSWKLLLDGMSEIAAHRPNVRIAIEYKPKEPRANIFVRNAGTLLYIIKTLGMPNVGATIDFGHSLVAGENPAEAAVLLAREDALFQVHVNDNYRDWDHDLVVGTVSFWETLEFFYWLLRCGYDGWYLMDVYPYREDGLTAFRECVYSMEKYLDMAKTLLDSGLNEFLIKADAMSSSKLIREMLFK